MKNEIKEWVLATYQGKLYSLKENKVVTLEALIEEIEKKMSEERENG